MLTATKDGNKKRTDLADVEMDAVPIQLPAEAGRGPLKRRQAAPIIAQNSSLQYQAGLFDVITTFFPGLVADSATVYTATSLLTVLPTAVPIWMCKACLAPSNAIVVRPVSVIGPTGVISPPPGYLVI